jgi:hypothetical protein
MSGAFSVEKDYIICGNCNRQFDRSSEFKHCSNCFACTGCEIYYCPKCDEEIIIKAPKQPKEGSRKKL